MAAKTDNSKSDIQSFLQTIIKKRQCHKSINVAVTCSALFDLSEDLKVYDTHGQDAYLKLQMDKEQDVLKPGTVMSFVKALESINKQLLSIDGNEDELFDVVLFSQSSSSSGLRLIHSIEKHDLSIQRMCFTDGGSPVSLLKAYNIHLFLSTSQDQVSEALDQGFAAATVYPQELNPLEEDQLRIAFDLDSVLFSDETEQVLKSQGLLEYIKYERQHCKKIIGEGPLRAFALAIGQMQIKFRNHAAKFSKTPLRTYVVTARGRVIGERAIRTLKEWGLDINEVHFLGLAPKGPVLSAINPHMFFDDSYQNIESAMKAGVAAAHVGPRKHEKGNE